MGTHARPGEPWGIPAWVGLRGHSGGAIVSDAHHPMNAERDHHQSRTRLPLTRADVMTAAEVAQLLGLPKSTVYDLARRGDLPCARLGRTIRFVRHEVEARLLDG